MMIVLTWKNDWDINLTEVPRLGKIAIWLVLIAIACGLVLYLAVRTNLIQ
jgi:hypothetical protein